MQIICSILEMKNDYDDDDDDNDNNNNNLKSCFMAASNDIDL